MRVLRTNEDPLCRRSLDMIAAARLMPPGRTTRRRECGMRAAIFRNGEIVADRWPDPVPGTGQVLVKTLACGICGSDLHARKHAHRMAEITRHMKGRRPPMDPSRDVVFGHEFCCEILDYGASTQRRFKPGTRVCSVPALLS